MHTVLIANRTRQERDTIQRVLNTQYQVLVATSLEEIMEQDDSYDLLLLDTNFTDAHGIDVLMEMARHTSKPILMVTPLDEPQTAVEAMRCGAFNYLVKTDNYRELLLHAIHEALTHFNEREEMQRTIVTQKESIAALEARLGMAPSDTSPAAAHQPHTPQDMTIASKLLDCCDLIGNDKNF